MKKLLIYAVPFALMASQASGAPSSGWEGIPPQHIGGGIGRDAAPLVLAQHRGGGGRVNRGNVSRANVNRGNFNSRNFQRDVSANRNFSANRNVNVNRNVSVNRGYYGGGSYGPNWGGVAAGVAVGAGVAAVATSAAAASSTYYPPPPPYQYYPYNYGY